MGERLLEKDLGDEYFSIHENDRIIEMWKDYKTNGILDPKKLKLLYKLEELLNIASRVKGYSSYINRLKSNKTISRLNSAILEMKTLKLFSERMIFSYSFFDVIYSLNKLLVELYMSGDTNSNKIYREKILEIRDNITIMKDELILKEISSVGNFIRESSTPTPDLRFDLKFSSYNQKFKEELYIEVKNAEMQQNLDTLDHLTQILYNNGKFPLYISFSTTEKALKEAEKEEIEIEKSKGQNFYKYSSSIQKNAIMKTTTKLLKPKIMKLIDEINEKFEMINEKTVINFDDKDGLFECNVEYDPSAKTKNNKPIVSSMLPPSFGDTFVEGTLFSKIDNAIENFGPNYTDKPKAIVLCFADKTKSSIDFMKILYGDSEQFFHNLKEELDYLRGEMQSSELSNRLHYLSYTLLRKINGLYLLLFHEQKAFTEDLVGIFILEQQNGLETLTAYPNPYVKGKAALLAYVLFGIPYKNTQQSFRKSKFHLPF